MTCASRGIKIDRKSVSAAPGRKKGRRNFNMGYNEMIRTHQAVIVAAAGVLFTLSSVAAAAPVAPSSEFNTLGQQVGAITTAMGNQDMSKASEGLNGLFTGSGSKKDSTGSSLVVAGDWKAASRLGLPASRPQTSRRRDVPTGLMALRVDEETQGAKFITVGAKEDAAIALAIALAEKAARAAEEAARRYAERDQTEESKKKYGGCRMNNTCPK